MKIYITGSVASGKSTLARRIAAQTGIPCLHLDEAVYVVDPAEAWGNHKRPEEERDAIFCEMLARGAWVMEDAGRACFAKAMTHADIVVLLEIPLAVRKRRILTRWLRQNLGIEWCIYRPSLRMLANMFRWANNYDTGADGTKSRVAPYREKTVVLHDNREIDAFVRTLTNAGK
ncbi:MAG: hypothetical protein VB111_05795 [Clostridiaceae bacterium]|nr:hypothetical protein [Clostridiaceae bacterium]